MPLIVYKSQLGGADFPAEVEAYRQALLEHRFVGDAAPHAHAMIEAAVRRVPQGEGKPDDFVADYEIVDDTPRPPAPPSVADRKAAIVGRLYAAEAAAYQAVITDGKLRLLSLDAAEAMQKPEADRTAVDAALIDRVTAVNAKRSEILRHAATVHAAIDDLPADQIDTFEIPAFPA